MYSEDEMNGTELHVTTHSNSVCYQLLISGPLGLVGGR